MDFDVHVTYYGGDLRCMVNGKEIPQDFASIHVFANGGFGQPAGYRLEMGATSEEADGGSAKQTKEDAQKDLKNHSYL